MSSYTYKSINTKVFFIITISIFFLIQGLSYAQVFVPNQLNIKISTDIVKEGNVGDYVLFLSTELEKDLKYIDSNLEVRIKKMFLANDPESQLSCWYKIKFISEKSLDLDEILKNLLENYEHIVNAEHEYIMNSRIIPNDTVMGQMTNDYYGLIGAYEAWDIEKGHSDVIVALIDSGVDVNHPDLKERFVEPNKFKRYEPDSSIDPYNPTVERYLYQGKSYYFDIYIDPEELNNGILPPEHDVRDVVPHGTPVAGIIAANHNTIGIPGICPNCKILPIKASYLEHLVEKSGTISPFTQGTSTSGTIAEAIEYAAENGADVINLSMSTSSKSTVLETAVNAAASKCIIIATGDNEDEEDEAYPAAYDNVIGVTAAKFDSQNRVLKRTNAQYGTWIDVVAPGDNVFSLTLGSNSIKTYSGTSLAVPFVTGLAALVRSRNPNFNIYNFRYLLRESSTPIYDPLYAENKLGYGLINLKKAMDKLNDPFWIHGSITQQGHTSSSGVSGGSNILTFNPVYTNPYSSGFSFYPSSSFGGYGAPTYNTYSPLFGGAFSPYFQQPYYSSFQQPYYSSFQQPYYSSSYVLPIQYNQSSSYSPYGVSPFSQSNPIFQRYSPYGGFGGIFSPFMGGFGGSPFIVYSFPVYR